MDQKNEFNKWIKSVEAALSEDTMVDEEILEQGSCGCGAWNCPDCFPDDQGDLAGLEGQQIPAIIVIPSTTGQQPQQDMQKQPEQEPQGVGMAGTHPADSDTFDHDDDDNIDFTLMGDEAFAEDAEEEFTDEVPQTKLPRAQGGGVKLGDIVQKFVKANRTGEESPLTYGDELEEDEFSDEDEVSYDDAAPIAKQNYHDEMSQIDPEEAMELIQQINNMQDLGFSKSDTHYTEDDLANLPAVKLRQIHQQVMGGTNDTSEMDEATGGEPPKKTKTKFRPQDIDFGDDIFGGKSDQPLANYDNPDDGEFNDTMDRPNPAMPTASASDTRRATSGIRPDAEMMGWLGRINRAAGGTEPELPRPQDQENAIVPRNASDVPAIISSAMQATGMQSPKWHTINNLPGYRQPNVRGMGRSIFSMFTSTPLEQIKTIANVQGQGPNTEAEMSAVGNWLMQNAEDMGDVQLDHGEAIPGYRPKVKEYSINGVRFHVVRDSMGQYIYAYPDADSTTNQGAGQLGNQQDQEEEPRMLGRNIPRLRESTGYSLFEELAWDDKIRSSIKSLLESELEEGPRPRRMTGKPGDPDRQHLPGIKARPDRGSSVSRVIGKMQGGKKLIDILHKTHKLSNEAELEPVSVSRGKDAAELAWAQFNNNADDFIVVSGRGGVAAIKPEPESLAAFKANAAKKGKEPNYSKHAGAIRYEVIAYKDDGERVPSALLRQPKYRDDTATEIKARMGLVHGEDKQNPDNIFNLLNAQIGPITTVWIAGWAGKRGGEETSELPASPGAVERGKIATRSELSKGTSAPRVDRRTAVTGVFNRMKPVLKHVIDKAAGRVSSALNRANQGKNRAEAKRLMDVEEKIEGFQMALNTSKEIPLTPDLEQMFTSALVRASGAPNAYSDEFLDYLNDLVAPGPSIGGKTTAKAGSAKLYDVADALGKAFMGALR